MTAKLYEKSKEIDSIFVSYSSFGRMVEEKRREIIKWQTEGLRDATGILERVKKTENKE